MAAKALIQQTRKKMQRDSVNMSFDIWKAIASTAPEYSEEWKDKTKDDRQNIFSSDLIVMTQLVWDLVAITCGEKTLSDPKYYAAFVSALPSFPAGVIEDLQDALLMFIATPSSDAMDDGRILLSSLIKSPAIDTVPGMRNLVIRMSRWILYELDGILPSPYRGHEKETLLSLVEHDISLKTSLALL
jgi:hypothetical protein